jgi:hypothetical protein
MKKQVFKKQKIDWNKKMVKRPWGANLARPEFQPAAQQA